ncbi:MAG TPA: hypothetical protein VKA14_07895 [Gammaproteobacteria bacterium]|nr:hypothetical protein [Gammaproteobacteria bacterium]
MRSYENLPVMAWGGDRSAMRVRAQLLHEEPVILNMGRPFDVASQAGGCGCRHVAEDGRYLGCNPARALGALAGVDGWTALDAVGQAATRAGFVADLDPGHGRIVLHD